MNDIILNILERRSIRRYEDKAVSKETMAEILNAGAWAPSAMNRQTWRLTGIIDPEKVQKLAAAVKKRWERPVGGLSFYHAPAFIIASNTRGYANGMADCACAMENMMLAAHPWGWAPCDQPAEGHLRRRRRAKAADGVRGAGGSRRVRLLRHWYRPGRCQSA